MTDPRIETLIQRLEAWFADCDSALVAFSGGIDSALVAFLARRWLGRDRCLAVVGSSASLKSRDLQAARDFATEHDIRLEVVPTGELDDPVYRSNPEDRCFHCKSELYRRLEDVRTRHAVQMILGGENADDQGDYRPGLRAVERFGVRGPLAECGATKDELRAIARHFGLQIWDKPASPCLSSRIPYFQEVTAAKLERIERGETWLEQRGFPVARVRHPGAGARIEVPPARIGDLRRLEAELVEIFAGLGFEQVEIDPEGFVSGKLNRALEE